MQAVGEKVLNSMSNEVNFGERRRYLAECRRSLMLYMLSMSLFYVNIGIYLIKLKKRCTIPCFLPTNANY